MKLKINEDKTHVILGPEKQKIKREVYNYVYWKLSEFVNDNFPCQQVAIDVEGYNPDWCAEESIYSISKELEQGLSAVANAMANDFMYNANKIEL